MTTTIITPSVLAVSNCPSQFHAEQLILERVVGSAAALSTCALNTTTHYDGFFLGHRKLADTVQAALTALRERCPHGKVMALVSPVLASAMRNSTRFGDIEIIEHETRADGENHSSMLFIEGAIGVVLSEIKHRTQKVRLTGWRRWLMPWAKRTELVSHASSGCAIIDQDKVQEIITPTNAAGSILASLGVRVAPLGWRVWEAGCV